MIVSVDVFSSNLIEIGKTRIEKGFSITDITRLIGNYIKHEREEVKEQYKCIETLKSFLMFSA